VQLERAKLETERVELKKSRLALEEAWIAVQAEIRKNKIALQKQNLALKKQGVLLQKQEFEARQAYQVQYLLALRNYHQARIQTELRAAQTAFDTIKSPFCLSRSDKVSLELTADPSHFKDPNCPVENVSWEQCIEFCLRLSRETGKPYRLPSEAEREYACRVGTQTPYHFGLVLGKQFANHGESGRSKPIRSSNEPNDWGLYDMHGNVWEWCMDDWHSYQGAATDGSTWIDNDNHSHPGNREGYLKAVLNSANANKLLRGGSWYGYPKRCRSAIRFNSTRVLQYNYIGFRLSLPRT